MSPTVAEFLQEARECDEEALRCEDGGHLVDADAWRTEASFLRLYADELTEQQEQPA